jgi:hypothetical protein
VLFILYNAETCPMWKIYSALNDSTLNKFYCNIFQLFTGRNIGYVIGPHCPTFTAEGGISMLFRSVGNHVFDSVQFITPLKSVGSRLMTLKHRRHANATNGISQHNLKLSQQLEKSGCRTIIRLKILLQQLCRVYVDSA